MSESINQFIEEKIRLALTGTVQGAQIDSLITHLTTLFRTLRPSIAPTDVFIAISGPTVCGEPHCHCSDVGCKLENYNITIFIDRREQGRRVTKPWVRASSTEGFEDAVKNLMAAADELIEKVKPGEGKGREMKREKSVTCLVEIMMDEHAT